MPDSAYLSSKTGAMLPEHWKSDRYKDMETQKVFDFVTSTVTFTKYPHSDSYHWLSRNAKRGLIMVF